LPTRSVPQAPVRRRYYSHVRAMVSTVLVESAGRGRAYGRARLGRGSHDDLALDSVLWSGGAAPLAGQIKQKGSTWHMDETFVRIAGRWLYLFRAVDSSGQTDREAAKCFLKRALANPDNRPPHVFARDKLRSYPAAIRELQREGHLPPRCRHRTHRYANNRIESDHRDARAADSGDCRFRHCRNRALPVEIVGAAASGHLRHALPRLPPE